MIVIYYVVIIVWVICYVGFFVMKMWGYDLEGFFMGSFLYVVSNVDVEFYFVFGVFWLLLLLWFFVFVIMVIGVEKGIIWVLWIFMLLFVVMFIILVIVVFIFDGVLVGFNVLFILLWGVLGNYWVWMVVYG